MGTPQHYSEHVCVAIAANEISVEMVQEHLGAAWPLRVTRWGQQSYLTVIRQLRPSVIVVVTAEQAPVEETALLLSALFDRYSPTIASLTLPTARSAAGAEAAQPTLPLLIVWSLGRETVVHILGLEYIVARDAQV
jgi:hypothetical protein